MIPFLSFLSVFAVYLSTLYPHIAPEDSGEFVTAAWTLGIPHPSGYSLYVLLGKAATVLVPFGNPAYRVNLLSAALGAGSVLLMAALLRRFASWKTPAANMLEELEVERWKNTSLWTAALLWAAVPGAWYLSLLAEVWGLVVFLGLLALLGVAQWMDLDRALSRAAGFARWSAAAFAWGLGLGMHHTLVLWAPGFAALARAGADANFSKPASAARAGGAAPRFDWKPLARLAAAFLALGLSVQLFLLFRAGAEPLLNTGAPDGIVRWLRVLLRQDYGTFSLAKEQAAASLAAPLLHYMKSALEAFTWPGTAFLLWGAWRMAHKEKKLFLGIALLWLVSGPVFLVLGRPPADNHFRGVIERFYPLSFAPLAVFLCWGIYDAGLRSRWFRLAAAALLPLAFAAHVFVSGRGNLHARDFGANLMKSLPPGSVLWDPGDSAAYSLLYLQKAAGHRPDIASVHYHTTRWGQENILKEQPDLVANAEAGPGRDFLPRLLAGPRREKIFAEVPKSLPGVDPSDGLSERRAYPADGLPFGLAYRYFPSDTHKLVEPLSQLSVARLTFWWYRRTADHSLGGRPSRAPVPEEFHKRDPFTIEILRRYAEAHTNLGQKFAEYRLDDAATAEYRRALAIDPAQMEAYNNLGVTAYQTGRYKESAWFFRRALAQQPKNLSIVLNLAYASRAAGDAAEALVLFRRVLEGEPESAPALRGAAALFQETGKHEEARDHWERLRRLTQDDKDVYWGLITAAAALQRNDEALKTLSEYFLLNLTDEEKTAAEDLRRSLLALQPGN